MPDADEDIDGHADGKEQVADGHCGGGPHGDEEAKVDGVADEFIEERGAETEAAFLFIREMVDGLGEAEEMKVIDEEGADQDDAPAEEGGGDEDGTACR